MVRSRRFRVVWTNQSRDSLKKIHDRIALESPTAGRKVKQEILRKGRSLRNFPRRCPKDRFIEECQGDVRFLVAWNYKIVFEVTDKDVVVHEVFHTSRDPQTLILKKK